GVLRGGLAVLKYAPLSGGSAVEQGRGMAGVADGKMVGGRKERGDQRGGEDSGGGEDGELLVHGADEAGLVDVVDVLAHERAELCAKVRDGRAVAGDIGDEKAG